MNALLSNLAWIGTAGALIGTFFLARDKKGPGFAFLLLSLGFSAPVQVETRTWPQVALFVVLAALYAHGLARAHRYLSQPKMRSHW